MKGKVTCYWLEENILFCKGMRGSSFYATHNTFNNVLHRTGAAKSRLVAESKCWPDLDFCYKWHGVFDGREEPGTATAPSSYCQKATRIQKVRGTCPPRWRHWPCWPSPSWSARWRTSYQPSPGAQIYLDFLDQFTWIGFVGGSKSFFNSTSQDIDFSVPAKHWQTASDLGTWLATRTCPTFTQQLHRVLVLRHERGKASKKDLLLTIL